MKKIVNLFIIIILIITLSGCNNEEFKETRNPIKVLSDTIKNDKELNQMSANITASVKASAQGVSVDSNIGGKISFLKDGSNVKVSLELDDNPLVGSMKTYFDLSNKILTTYVPSSVYDMINGINTELDCYIKSENEITYDEEANEVNNYIKNVDFEKILTDNDFMLINRNGRVAMYRLVISKDLINRIGKSIDIEMANVDDFNGNINLNITIDEENNRITEVSCDLLDFIKANIDDIEMDEVLQKLSFNIKFEYENIDVTIPSDVINNIMTIEEYSNKYLINEEY